MIRWVHEPYYDFNNGDYIENCWLLDNGNDSFMMTLSRWPDGWWLTDLELIPRRVTPEEAGDMLRDPAGTYADAQMEMLL